MSGGRDLDCIICAFSTDDTSRVFETLMELRGKRCYRWILTDFPSNAVSNCQAGGSEALVISDPYGSVDLLEAVPRSIWIWRLAPSKFKHMNLHPDDVFFVGATNRAYQNSMLHLLGKYHAPPDVNWINPFPSSKVSDSKLAQLIFAKRAGFSIPDTLVSNDYERIVRFVSDRRCVRKDLVPFAWDLGTENQVANFTSRIAAEDISDNDALRSCVSVFQEEVKKQYELRVTIVDEYVLAVAIHSQKREETSLDWRSGDLGTHDIETVKLEDDVLQKCLTIVRGFGLKYAALDLIVNEDGEHVFLEINSMGQFLWVDSMLEDSFLVEAFFELLTEGRVPSDWRPRSNAIHLREIEKMSRYRERLAADLERPILQYPDDYF